MKKQLLATLLLLLFINGYSQAVWNNTTFVHRNNKQILDGQGNVIRLDGVNLGGWLMWEGWIWGGGFTQQKTIYNNLQSAMGTPVANAFRDSAQKYFITKKDIQHISEECYNVVRIPFNSSLLEDDFTPYVYKPAGWALLDSALSWCEQYNVYALLDMHSAPGGQSNSFTADPDFLVNLWNGSVNQKRTRLMWKAIANRYKDRGIIAGYDLLNEPNAPHDSDLVNMYNGIIDSIRTVDTHHMFSLEGNNFATDFSIFSTLHDANTSFHFHMYTWFFPGSIGTHLAAFTAFSNTINAPIFCGEWGENSYAQLDTTRTLLNDPSYGVSGNAFWTWKKMFGSSNYTNYNAADTTTNWERTIDWIGNTSLPQPDSATMINGINEFIYNIQADHCHRDTTLSNMLRDCTSTGIAAITAANDASVYPNPASALVNIVFTNTLQGTLTLMDVTGKVISTQRVEHSDRAVLNIGGLSRGMYLIRVSEDAGGISVSKIMKE